MIIHEKITIKIAPGNFSWFKKRGYSNFKCGDYIEISLDDINIGSTSLVEAQCQGCKSIKSMKYNTYYWVTKKLTVDYLCNKCSVSRQIETNLKKYGCKSSLQNEKVREKSKISLLKKYGVDNISKLDVIKEQRSILMKENTDYYNNIIVEKYGKNVSGLEWVKEKKKETMLKKWGVENPSQSSQIFEKSQKNGKKIKLHECGLYYRGSYEKHFIDFCINNKIKVDKGMTINFRINNNSKVYHSDFFIKDKNLIVEIKSSYYYKKFEELNNIKKEETIKSGYDHIFIIDKDYSLLKKIIQ
jgi:hypothetical protein